MPIYRVIRKSDQEQVYAYSADAPIEWVGFEFATHDHVQVVEPPAPPPPPAPATPTRITKLSFRQRFLQSERVAIEIASLDNPAADMSVRAQAATLRTYLKDIDAASHVDLNFPATRAGVQMLEAVGLIGVGRAAVILDTPPSADEVWNG
ncbi:MAG: hypothetical protein N2688_00475 [Burkholderiaceae bacterium]|nr:hypothetical protein [Burkholderiaceae bacterium]